jgi:hypothetical protein
MSTSKAVRPGGPCSELSITGPPFAFPAVARAGVYQSGQQLPSSHAESRATAAPGLYKGRLLARLTASISGARRTALLGRLRVERRANGDASSVMAATTDWSDKVQADESDRDARGD